jgi:hypothetical protein|tara:strand:- start:192 stop:656 length:465 start_codon:yes stop_codon:yes gene_type:complete
MSNIILNRIKVTTEHYEKLNEIANEHMFEKYVPQPKESEEEGWDWYTWNIENWGSKSGIYPDKDRIHIGQGEFTFYTANGAMGYKVLDELLKDIPTLSFYSCEVEERLSRTEHYIDGILVRTVKINDDNLCDLYLEEDKYGFLKLEKVKREGIF